MNLTSTSPAGIETKDSLKSHCNANSPGFDVQLLELSCHEPKSVYSLFVPALRIWKVSVPFNGSGEGPLLTAVPLMNINSLMSKTLELALNPSSVTVRFGEGVILKLKSNVFGLKWYSGIVALFKSV